MDIVVLEGMELKRFLEHMQNAKNAYDIGDLHTLRLTIDESGLIIKMNSYTWSPHYGTKELR